MDFSRVLGAALTAALFLTACNRDSSPILDPGTTRVLRCAEARVVASDADLVPGPNARGVPNDFVLENDVMRAIVQKGGRNWYNISQFGGNIIDASLKHANGALRAGDQFEEFVLGTNIESAPNYQTVEVLEPGGEAPDGTCQPAKIRAAGPDDLLDFVNGSSAIRDLGVFYPDSADDVDLPVMIETVYTLEQGKRYIRIDTTLQNETSSALDIYLVEYLNGSGELEVFQAGYGFGEAFVTAPCDECNYVVYAGHEGGRGTSYGVIHDIAGTSSVSVSGVTVFVYGRDLLLVVTDPAIDVGGFPVPTPNPNSQPNFTVPADGELTVTRYFAVGDGTVASVLDVRNEILGIETGRLEGIVTDAGGPVEGAEIAVLTSDAGFPDLRGPDLLVVNHFRTGPDGRFGGTLPPGDYELRLNGPARAAGTPSVVDVTVSAGETTVQDFQIPRPGRLRVLVRNPGGLAIPAKVQLAGADESPDAGEPQNGEAVLGGVIAVQTSVFGDAQADPLAPGLVLTEFAVRDSGSGPVSVGDTGELSIEPGEYILSVSRGNRYSEFTQSVTIAEGQLTTVTATLAEVVPTPGYVFGDFHVHSYDSPDSEVTNRERVATYVSEDLDFFTPSDHGMRVDFAPVVAAMGLNAWIATAPSAEITTFDYGHFNAWPVQIETQSPDVDDPGTGQSLDPKISFGSVDWGGAAPLGQDFPSAGHFSLTPEQIYGEAHADPVDKGPPPRDVVVQINHVDTHFGAVGLGIDTGTPGTDLPQSSADPAAKRLDPALGPNYYSDDYDALELWIGTDNATGQYDLFLGENLGDWFNLLNKGLRHTGVSDSDTHQRRVTSMHTRNLISVPAALLDGGRADFGAIGADPHTVGDSVRAGHTTMTNAPFLSVKLRNGAGQIAGLDVTDAFGIATEPLPLSAPDEEATLEIGVMSPLWAEYDRIAIYVNGATVRRADDTGLCPAAPARYAPGDPAIELILGDDFERQEVTVNANVPGARRYESSVSVPVPSPGQDYWVVVLIEGSEGTSRPLWPVVPNSFVDGGDGVETRSAGDSGIRALAVTNPIYVDADNDGAWTPPGVQTSDEAASPICP